MDSQSNLKETNRSINPNLNCTLYTFVWATTKLKQNIIFKKNKFCPFPCLCHINMQVTYNRC